MLWAGTLSRFSPNPGPRSCWPSTMLGCGTWGPSWLRGVTWGKSSTLVSSHPSGLWGTNTTSPTTSSSVVPLQVCPSPALTPSKELLSDVITVDPMNCCCFVNSLGKWEIVEGCMSPFLRKNDSFWLFSNVNCGIVLSFLCHSPFSARSCCTWKIRNATFHHKWIVLPSWSTATNQLPTHRHSADM